MYNIIKWKMLIHTHTYISGNTWSIRVWRIRSHLQTRSLVEKEEQVSGDIK